MSNLKFCTKKSQRLREHFENYHSTNELLIYFVPKAKGSLIHSPDNGICFLSPAFEWPNKNNLSLIYSFSCPFNENDLGKEKAVSSVFSPRNLACSCVQFESVNLFCSNNIWLQLLVLSLFLLVHYYTITIHASLESLFLFGSFSFRLKAKLCPFYHTNPIGNQSMC